jgi:hypothetical protein
MISRSSRWIGVAFVIFPVARLSGIEGRQAFSALRRRRRGRGRSMRSPSICALAIVEDPRCSASMSGTSSTWLQARHSANASSARDVTNNGSVKVGSRCVSTTASASSSPASPGISHNETPSKAATGILRAMRIPRSALRMTTRSRWSSTSRTCPSAAASPAKKPHRQAGRVEP